MQGRSQKEIFSPFQEGLRGGGRAAVAANGLSLNTLLTLANLLVVACGVKPHSTGEVTRLLVSSNGASKNKVAIAHLSA